MAKKQTSPEVSAAAARIMGLDDDQIYAIVMGPNNLPTASLPRGVGFAQFCRDIRSIAASVVAQDEKPGK